MKKQPPDRQTVIEGAEPISQADFTRRLAERKLKPRVEQRPPVGLFSDDKDQMDLIDIARRTKP